MLMISIRIFGRFNPRSPRGGATTALRREAIRLSGFNPRSPRGGATPAMPCDKQVLTVSIHAPHEGERLHSWPYPFCHVCFNPRSPRGGATICRAISASWARFQSTLPTRGSDKSIVAKHLIAHPFQSTLPTRGSDANREAVTTANTSVSIHAPHEGERHHGVSLISP